MGYGEGSSEPIKGFKGLLKDTVPAAFFGAWARISTAKPRDTDQE